MKSSYRLPLSFIILLLSILVVAPASAGTVWTDWTSMTVGGDGRCPQCLPLGGASGILDGVTVTYSGEVISKTVTDGSFASWSPNSSFIGGTVTTSPSTVGDIIGLSGVYAPPYGGTGAITFASPIINPLFAIWSMGDANTLIGFTFDLTPTFEAGGPNTPYGGGPISVSGNLVSGMEGNGVVQFTGTFSGLSWTNTPQSGEYWYGFTVGVPEQAAIPEPASLLLLGSGLIGLAGYGRKKFFKK